jgi:predicted metalloprotease
MNQMGLKLWTSTQFLTWFVKHNSNHHLKNNIGILPSVECGQFSNSKIKVIWNVLRSSLLSNSKEENKFLKPGLQSIAEKE